ncbi:hypothetical protein XAC908_760002 [Xanthomonas citri pv. citri]|nr:hypothetical protein XAC908_760002 [Xanthomonas citri pv. citri]
MQWMWSGGFSGATNYQATNAAAALALKDAPAPQDP